MKSKPTKLKTLLMSLAALTLIGNSANAATIIAYWDNWTDQNSGGGYAADGTASGWSGANITANNFRRFSLNGQSTDSSFGPSLGTASTSPAMGLQFNSATADTTFNVNITNTTGSSITLSELLFDFSYDSGTLYDTYSVVFQNITQSTTSGVLGSNTFTTFAYHDIAINASSITLANGDSGRFIVTLSGGGGGQSNSLDNVAVTVVPEPGSIALLGLGGLFLLIQRRRFR